ncbi:MAG: hypothetical protein PHC61_07210, partial [Chitinivibrionales bacterium]|nr:hypothetical protein [Chitinivibrionales bacterium]
AFPWYKIGSLYETFTIKEAEHVKRAIKSLKDYANGKLSWEEEMSFKKFRDEQAFEESWDEEPDEETTRITKWILKNCFGL